MAGTPLRNARNRIVRDAIMRGLAEGKEPSEFLVPFTEKLKEMALAGDISALRELFDRLDGKPSQQLVHSGDEDNPVVQKIVRDVVKP